MSNLQTARRNPQPYWDDDDSVWYHGTSALSLFSVLEDGIKPQMPRHGASYDTMKSDVTMKSYVTPSFDRAAWYARSWHVDPRVDRRLFRGLEHLGAIIEVNLHSRAFVAPDMNDMVDEELSVQVELLNEFLEDVGLPLFEPGEPLSADQVIEAEEAFEAAEEAFYQGEGGEAPWSVTINITPLGFGFYDLVGWAPFPIDLWPTRTGEYVQDPWTDIHFADLDSQIAGYDNSIYWNSPQYYVIRAIDPEWLGDFWLTGRSEVRDDHLAKIIRDELDYEPESKVAAIPTDTRETEDGEEWLTARFYRIPAEDLVDLLEAYERVWQG